MRCPSTFATLREPTCSKRGDVLSVPDSRVEVGHIRGRGAVAVGRRVRRVVGTGHVTSQPGRTRVAGDQLVRRHVSITKC